MLYWAWDTNLYMYNMKENHNNNSSIQYVCHAYKESLVGDVYQHTEQLSLVMSLLCIKILSGDKLMILIPFVLISLMFAMPTKS